MCELDSLDWSLLFVLFVLLYFWYSNKPGNHVLLFPGFVLSKVQRKYKKSITFSITFSMLVEPGMYFLYFFKNWGFSLVHSPAICFVFAQTQPDNYLLNAVMANTDNNSVNNDEEDEQLGASTSIDEEVDEVAQVSRMDDYIQEKNGWRLRCSTLHRWIQGNHLSDAVEEQTTSYRANARAAKQ